MKNKKIVWVIAIIVILGGAFYIYNQKQDNGPKIEEQLKGIDKEAVAFENEKNESKQFKELEKLIKESDEYKKGTETNKKVIKRYDDSIYQARKLLKDKNETTFEESKITNLSKASTRNITMKVNSLKVLSKRLEIQDVTVYDKKELNNFKSKVTTLKKSYDKQLNKSDSESNQKSESASTKVNEQPDQTMDFSKITQGDYTSLLGDWKEVAATVNYSNGKGVVWSTSTDSKLSITKNQLTDESIKLQGNTLVDYQGSNSVKFNKKDGYLMAQSDDGAIARDVVFYPEGIAFNPGIDGKPTSIDDSKDRIVISSSGGFQQIYEKVDGSTSVKKNSNVSSTDKAKMDINEIKTGDYATIDGTWKNKHGREINVGHDTMKFTDITGFKQAGEVRNLKLNIPELNLANGKPKLAGLYQSGDELMYKQQLQSTITDGALELKGSVSRSGLFVFFLPKGTKGELTAGDISKDKIVALSTQGELSMMVTESDVYYRVN
ncbi:DUF6287 domain-containing protein [Dellaglioa carnosa]|uniref:DUF6287 domain-containing protein n=1 Tax=Dellaglioa carnosa TaxID=2995136 RepID=UPI0022A80CB3|nr:DUF6287 domain-containing protein [Dellaglioa carnosa]MCZ2492056.1 DUF6287 domain-containing protein [Dellaglioa carnosa]